MRWTAHNSKTATETASVSAEQIRATDMGSMPKAISVDADKANRDLTVTPQNSEPNAVAIARVCYDPAVRALGVGRAFMKPITGAQGVPECFEVLRQQIEEVKTGNLASAERALVVQANTLDAIFNEMARRAAVNMGEHLGATEIYMRLALKAQNQCRTTLETLATIKNPPVIIAKQANVTTGPQQVNNGVAVHVHASETRNLPTELSGAAHELHQKPRASCLAGPDDKALEAVGVLDRPQDE